MKTRIDFVPGVAPYELSTEVEFQAIRGGTKLVFTSSKLHAKEFQEMARLGQMSQLDKLARLVGELTLPGVSKHRLELTLPSEREVLLTRVFDAPRERVFRAHVDPMAFVEWWGPRDYTTRLDRWEPRPGGGWRAVQRTPDGAEHGFHGVFQEVTPPERIAWTFEYEGAPGHVVKQTVTFDEVRGGKTKLTVRALFANPEDRDAMLASGMEWGARQGYERLDELLREED